MNKGQLVRIKEPVSGEEINGIPFWDWFLVIEKLWKVCQRHMEGGTDSSTGRARVREHSEGNCPKHREVTVPKAADLLRSSGNKQKENWPECLRASCHPCVGAVPPTG